METATSSVHQRLLLACAGSTSATLLGLVAMAELLASSQFLVPNEMDAIAVFNKKRKFTSGKRQTGGENENQNNDSDNELGEEQDALENGEDGKNAPTKDGANGGEETKDGGASNDNGDGGSENSGDGGRDEDDDDDGGSEENDEDDKENEEDFDEEDVEEDTFEGEDDEETLPPPKKRKK
ncbi:uncharacterized protein DDB_G0290685-like isoform X2 [Cucurbita maxima]|nr:uncharacterized protein DDB_G0290685-like isoform X2 [Cucurbita maxima]